VDVGELLRFLLEREQVILCFQIVLAVEALLDALRHLVPRNTYGFQSFAHALVFEVKGSDLGLSAGFAELPQVSPEP
jgi:hypothetical protein